jgi:hypothetical protein
VVRAESFGQRRLIGSPRNGRDPEAQLVGVLQPEVAKAADALDGHQGIRFGAHSAHPVIRGDPSAQQGGDSYRCQRVGYADQAGRLCVGDLGVAAVGGGVELGLVLAVDEIPATAPGAHATVTAEKPDSDAIAAIHQLNAEQLAHRLLP